MSIALSIIIVNYNEREYLRQTLQRLVREFDRTTTQIIVVDNNSIDDSAAMVKTDFSNVTLIEPHANLYYGKGNNVGLAVATGDWVMILNPDVDWELGALKRMTDWAQSKPGVDICAPVLRYRDGRIQASAHRQFPTLWTTFVDYCLPVLQLVMSTGHHPHQLSKREHNQTQIIAHATGACLLVRRGVIQMTGNFDPQFSMYLEETDWQRRMSTAGFQVWLSTETQLTHFGSAQKSFAQASRHYLWGLRLYAAKHWTLNQQTFLASTVMLATLVSIIFLALMYIPSYFIGRTGLRIRHYLPIYIGLVGKILTWPRQAPSQA